MGLIVYLETELLAAGPELRRAAHAVTASYSLDEVIRAIAESSLEATGADGAF